MSDEYFRLALAHPAASGSALQSWANLYPALICCILPPPSPPPPPPPPQINRSALRSYFIANILTFFLALSTTVFCASENMPHAVPPTAGRAVFSIVASTVLLFMTLASGASTFLSGALAVYPSSKYGELIPAAVVAGAILVLTFWWYSRHVWRLFFRYQALRRAAPFPHLEVTGSPRNVGVEKMLRAILVK